MKGWLGEDMGKGRLEEGGRGRWSLSSLANNALKVPALANSQKRLRLGPIIVCVRH
jgi:hypothetical protein